MRKLSAALLYPVGAILGAHGLAFLLVGALPHAAVSALGLFSANQELLSAFASALPKRSYAEALAGIFVGNLGHTLDGQAVSSELVRALVESTPRLMGTVLLLAGICFATAMAVREKTSLMQSVCDFIAFLPPYVAPFLGLAAVLGIQFSTGIPFAGAAFELVAVLSLTAGAGALLAAQTVRITQRNLRSDFARSIKAAGATAMQLRLRLLHNLVVEIAPTFEKMVIGVVAALCFTETILGLGGFGTLAVRAVRRSDVDLVLGVTLAVALLVALCRVLVWEIRSAYGVEE